MARSVIRHVPWTIAADTSEGASPPLYEMQCTTCDESSGAAEDGGTPQQWALEHSGRTRHTGYRGIGTTFWRTSIANGPSPK